jgi:hypothetical protein
MTSNAIEPSVKKTILRARRRASSLMRTASATCSEVAVVVFSRSASRSLLKTQFRCVIPTQESLPELPRRNRQMRAHHRTAVRRLPTNNRSFQRPLLRRILQHRRLLRDRPKLSVRRDQQGRLRQAVWFSPRIPARPLRPLTHRCRYRPLLKSVKASDES